MGTEERQYSRSTLITSSLWLATAGTLLMAWLVWLLGRHLALAILIAETACVLSAVAAVLQIRCFANRAMRLMRVLHGIERPDAEVSEFPPRR